MPGAIAMKYSHLSFAGAETKTIAPADSATAIKAVNILFFTAAAQAIDVKIGTAQVVKGTVAVGMTDIRVNNGLGYGGAKGDSLTFGSAAAGEAFVTYQEVSYA
jgi:hypothetical protein